MFLISVSNSDLCPHWQLSFYLTGFKAVESGFPPDIPIEELSNARENAQIEQILMNAFDGELLLGMNPLF